MTLLEKLKNFVKKNIANKAVYSSVSITNANGLANVVYCNKDQATKLAEVLFSILSKNDINCSIVEELQLSNKKVKGGKKK